VTPCKANFAAAVSDCRRSWLCIVWLQTISCYGPSRVLVHQVIACDRHVAHDHGSVASDATMFSVRLHATMLSCLHKSQVGCNAVLHLLKPYDNTDRW
jgi:hypothetical protein